MKNVIAKIDKKINEYESLSVLVNLHNHFETMRTLMEFVGFLQELKKEIEENE